MKRLLTLSTFLLLSIMTFASTLIDGIYYEFSGTGTEATVVKNPNTGGYTSSVTIPASVSYGGKTYSVTSIGSYAFEDCNKLTAITIPNSVTSIGYRAFSGCSGLTSVTIPKSLTSMGRFAFDGCTCLTSVIWNAKNCYGFLSTDYAPFYNIRTQIKEFIFGNEVERVPGYLCFGMTGLTSVNLPNSIKGISEYAFSGCSGLTSITIPNSVIGILNNPFENCSGLASVNVQEGNTKYDSRNNCNAIIETASNKLIAGCKNTVIPNSVTSIGYCAFSVCKGLTSITIPNSVTSIGGDAFQWCINLTSIEIPNSVTSIFEGAFSSCKGLTSIVFRNSTPSIDEYTFRSCEALTSIYSYTDTPESWTACDFENYHYTNATLYIPKGSKETYSATDGWRDFVNVEEVEGKVNLNSNGYATFSYNSDVKIEGAEVYTATKNGNRIKCTKAEQTVPAYNGVILKGEPNAEVMLLSSTNLSDLIGNELKATTLATGTAASETALVLSGKTFVNYTGGDFVADKAYMPYDGNSANTIEMVFDDATVVNSIASNNDLLDKTVIKTIEDGKLVIKTANGKYSSVGAKMK